MHLDWGACDTINLGSTRSLIDSTVAEPLNLPIVSFWVKHHNLEKCKVVHFHFLQSWHVTTVLKASLLPIFTNKTNVKVDKVFPSWRGNFIWNTASVANWQLIITKFYILYYLLFGILCTFNMQIISMYWSKVNFFSLSTNQHTQIKKMLPLFPFYYSVINKRVFFFLVHPKEAAGFNFVESSIRLSYAYKRWPNLSKAKKKKVHNNKRT